MSGSLQRRRGRKRQHKIETVKREWAPIIEAGEQTKAEMVVSTAAQQVRSGQLRSDAELHEDLAWGGDLDRVAGSLRTHEAAFQLLGTLYKRDPMAPQVEAQLERKVAMLRQILAEASGSADP